MAFGGATAHQGETLARTLVSVTGRLPEIRLPVGGRWTVLVPALAAARRHGPRARVADQGAGQGPSQARRAFRGRDSGASQL